MAQLTRISTMPTSDDPVLQEFALLASGPAATISEALTEAGGIPAWSTHMRIFVIEESKKADYSRQRPVPGEFITIRAHAEPRILELSGATRTMAMLNWLHQQLTAAGKAYNWSLNLVDEPFAKVNASNPVFSARTTQKLNPQRTLRAQGTFHIDHEAVRHYSLILDDPHGTVATADYSERSFGDLETFLNDFRKAKWRSETKLEIALFGDEPLTVQTPAEWRASGKMRPVTKKEAPPPPPAELDRPDLAEDDFWTLIAELHGKADPAGMERLEAQLASLTEVQIRAFSHYLTDALAALDSDEHRNQPIRDLADGPDDPDIDLSDDAFLYARCSAIISGHLYWSAAVRDPANFAGAHDLGAERLLFVAQEAYEQRTGRKWAWD